jgi:hypothetical protein
MSDEFIKEERFTTEGITADYVWWNANVLTGKMNQWRHDFDRVVNVMEARHKEHLKIIDDLLAEIKQLKEKLNESQRSSRD